MTDGIFIIRQIWEKHQSKRKKLYFTFVDPQKAFHRVPWEIVWCALRKAGVDKWLMKAVMAMYSEARVNVDMHQDSVLSPLLLAIVMDAVMVALVFPDDIIQGGAAKEALRSIRGAL